MLPGCRVEFKGHEQGRELSLGLAFGNPTGEVRDASFDRTAKHTHRLLSSSFLGLPYRILNYEP